MQGADLQVQKSENDTKYLTGGVVSKFFKEVVDCVMGGECMMDSRSKLMGETVL